MTEKETISVAKLKYPNSSDPKLQKKITLKKEFKYPYLIQSFKAGKYLLWPFSYILISP